MPTQINGTPDNVSLLGTVNILSSTNAAPVTITTSSAHGLRSGDRVVVSDHQVNTGANGTWQVYVLSATQLWLLGSTGTGTGGATGRVHPLAFATTIPVPSDGDDDAASSVNVATSAEADRLAYLLGRIGRDVEIGRATLMHQASALSDTWESLGSSDITYHTFATSPLPWTAVFGSGIPLSVAATDVVECDLSTTVDGTSTATNVVAEISLAYAFVAPGASPGAYTKWPGSEVLITTDGSGRAVLPLRLRGPALSAPSSGHISITVGVRWGDAGASTMVLRSSYALTVRASRYSGVLL